MLRFLQENINPIMYSVMIAALWLVIGFLSIRSDVKSLDKKRLDKGMAAMTDDEKHLVKQVFRSSIISNFFQVLIAAVVALLLAFFVS